MFYEDVITHAAVHHMAWSLIPSVEFTVVTTARGTISHVPSIYRIYMNISALLEACCADVLRIYVRSLQIVVCF